MHSLLLADTVVPQSTAFSVRGKRQRLGMSTRYSLTSRDISIKHRLHAWQFMSRRGGRIGLVFLSCRKTNHWYPKKLTGPNYPEVILNSLYSMIIRHA